MNGPSHDPTAQGAEPLAGGCLCGQVRFTYSGPLGGELGLVTVCHCDQCRKASGYAAGVVAIAASGFTVTEGRETVREYESSPGKLRGFCGACGSPLYSRREGSPDALRLRLGALLNPPSELKVQAHIFTADLPAWAEPDDAPRYPGFEPGRAK